MFKPGDKVICTDSSDFSSLTEGKVYTVSILDNFVPDKFFMLKEVPLWFSTNRFKLVEPAPLSGNVDLIQLSSSIGSVVLPKEQNVQASKNDKNKPDLSLIPKEALEAAAKAFMVGEKKYGRYNYYKGHSTSQLIAALIRHATSYMDGEENDPVDGQPHLGSVIACAAMILKQKALGTHKDDRYKPETK